MRRVLGRKKRSMKQHECFNDFTFALRTSKCNFGLGHAPYMSEENGNIIQLMKYLFSFFFTHSLVYYPAARNIFRKQRLFIARKEKSTCVDFFFYAAAATEFLEKPKRLLLVISTDYSRTIDDTKCANIYTPSFPQLTEKKL